MATAPTTIRTTAPATPAATALLWATDVGDAGACAERGLSCGVTTPVSSMREAKALALTPETAAHAGASAANAAETRAGSLKTRRRVVVTPDMDVVGGPKTLVTAALAVSTESVTTVAINGWRPRCCSCARR